MRALLLRLLQAEVATSLDVNACTDLLLGTRGGFASLDEREQLMMQECRVPLLGALERDGVPGYRYNASADCHFWARFGTRDRAVEGARELDFNRVAALRLTEPFEPPLRRNGTALYVGAHRTGEDGVALHRRHGLRMHLFEPSPTFFGSLRRAVGDLPGLTLHNYGLGARTRWVPLRLSGTASRTREVDVGGPADAAPDHGSDEEAVLIRAAAEAAVEVLGPHRAATVELVHVNCEGCEYDVVDGLRLAGLLPRVEHVQIATHLLDFLGPAATFQEAVEYSLQVSVKRYCEMHEILAQTHDRVWGLPWVWERWTLRKELSRGGLP